MENLSLTPRAFGLLETVRLTTADRRYEFATPELMLEILYGYPEMKRALRAVNPDWKEGEKEIKQYLDSLDTLPEREAGDQDETEEEEPQYSFQLIQLFNLAANNAVNAGRDQVDIPHFVQAILRLRESLACYALMVSIDGKEGEFLRMMVDAYSDGPAKKSRNAKNPADPDSSEFSEFSAPLENSESERGGDTDWRRMVLCVNDALAGRNPLVGREEELDRTVRVLCRKEKNNPLHLGEPGVGKTALVYGLARLINEGRVPGKLLNARIYSVELGSLLAGTQYRGDFEKKLKTLMEGLAAEPDPILYIDEIHTLVGAGAVGNGSLDASNILKPYLESGRIRFIGATTYDEFKRHFAKSKSLARRFSPIDIPEPSQEETVEILRQLRPGYEEFHRVEYDDEALTYAVEGSARYITDRFLPDKAIDLIDEAGAYRQTHPSPSGDRRVDKTLISEILAKRAKVEVVAIREEATKRLEDLETRISARIYGQPEAVRGVTEAVQMAKAGLTDETKPLASLLFVGPTGVGKTEVAKVLADELGVELVRFDMSEYMEKHAVAKLIGAPAGYVGYEDGGLLTDAVRQKPDCVLLLDEIEKAHEDIYNVLLQIMDYGRLTDNKGRAADFRNVILLMTSNAGAQHASRASLGFGSNVTKGEAMQAQIKRVFKPEFINRLTGTVVFHDMDRDMASRVLDKNLRRLAAMLERKGVAMELTEEAREYLLKKGFSAEYGARELDRVIDSSLKPLLMREILFGRLKEGGRARITADDGALKLTAEDDNDKQSNKNQK